MKTFNELIKELKESGQFYGVNVSFNLDENRDGWIAHGLWSYTIQTSVEPYALGDTVEEALSSLLEKIKKLPLCATCKRVLPHSH